ncbi:hypothetical protein ACS0TY_003709 [Phlomoides rotata]
MSFNAISFADSAIPVTPLVEDDHNSFGRNSDLEFLVHQKHGFFESGFAFDSAREAVKAEWEYSFLRKHTLNNLRWKKVCGKNGILSKTLKTRVEMECIWREVLCESSQVLKMESSFDANNERECIAYLFDLHLSAVPLSFIFYPAAENFDYHVAMYIRELICLEDVMEELGLGPNGGLMYCMDFFLLIPYYNGTALTMHLEENLDEWLTEELDNYLDDDYLVFDCPGQIELFSHVPMLKNFVEHLRHKNFNVCVVYLLDSQFITDVTKFISGCMASLSAMVQLELPHVNILSEMDLVTNKRDIENFLDPEPLTLLAELNKRMAPQFAKLNKSLIEVYAVQLVPNRQLYSVRRRCRCEG